MSAKSVVEAYNALYKWMSFERLGLLQLVRNTYSSQEVLYPGCSIHVTPSFVFSHVVYVDKSAEAKTFFDADREVLEFVTRNRDYQRRPCLQFIHQDYSRPLPLQKESFDLLLSFFAGRVAPACEKYLRKGGLYLTNQRGEVESDTDFELIAMIRFQGGNYRFASEANVPVTSRNTDKKAVKKYLRQSTRGLEYVESQSYFVFQKCS